MSDTKQTTPLSPLDWMMPRSYIRQILCFSSSDPQIPQILKDGLVGTLTDVPYLACGIVERDFPKGSVALSESYQPLDNLFSIQDLSETVDYSSLKSDNFSPSSMDGLDLFRTELDTETYPLPVLRATLSMVRNGFLLSVSIHHSTTDITGFGALLSIWASHCRTGNSRAVRFSANWMDREQFSSTSTDSSDHFPDLLHVRENSERKENLKSPASSEMESSIFQFQGQGLKNLKNQVIGLLPHSIPWISKSDILTAVLWSAIILTEPQDHTSPLEPRNCERDIRIPVNFRHNYSPPLPRGYLGAAFGVSLATAKESDLRSIATGTDITMFLSPLARVAAAVRKATTLVNEERMRSVVQYLAAQKDLSNIGFGPHNKSPSIVSWADEGVYDLNWGGKIGNCEAVRLPGLLNKRYPIVLPRLPSGDLEVFIRLEKEKMHVLRTEWVRFTG